MRVSNYPPDMFGLRYCHHEAEEQRSKEREVSKDDKGEEEVNEMDFEEEDDWPNF